MKTYEDWKVEQWEGEDYIVTGFGLTHPGVFTHREAIEILKILQLATPLIQKDCINSIGKPNPLQG